MFVNWFILTSSKNVPVLIFTHLILKTTGKNRDFAAVLISPAQLYNFLLGFQTRPVNNNPLSTPSVLICYVRACRFLYASAPVCVSYLEEGAVALQPGGAERGDGAQAAPEVDA